MKKQAKVIALDFDESLALYNPNIKHDSYVVKLVDSVPNPRIVSFVKFIRKQGCKVVIYSSRWWGDYNAIVDWLEKHRIVVDDIILGKFKADVYIDDKAVNAHDPIVETLTNKLLSETDSWGKWYSKYVGKKDAKKDR